MLVALLFYHMTEDYQWVVWFNVVPGAIKLVFDFCLEAYKGLKEEEAPKTTFICVTFLVNLVPLVLGWLLF